MLSSRVANGRSLPQPQSQSLTRMPPIAQQVILREIVVPVDQSVQIAPDLGINAMIGTFMIQVPSGSPFMVFLTTQMNTNSPSVISTPSIEIQIGASPVWQVATQRENMPPVVWDLSQFWLIGDSRYPGQSETILLSAYPLAI